MVVAMEERIKLGVSACLLRQNVRYNSGHRRDTFITYSLSQYVGLVPICPEVEYGLPVLRKAIRLAGEPDLSRLITSNPKKDRTKRSMNWSSQGAPELAKLNLYGFIFKTESPSNAMIRVKVYSDQGMPANLGIDMFGRAFTAHFHQLPIGFNSLNYGK
jgi:uncharacterized protein YbbK (DUF523 family)